MRTIKSLALAAVLTPSLLPGFAYAERIAGAAVADSLVVMATKIVTEYKALRRDCARLKDPGEKQSCYYRLRIKQWDYREAKSILERAAEPELLAQN